MALEAKTELKRCRSVFFFVSKRPHLQPPGLSTRLKHGTRSTTHSTHKSPLSSFATPPGAATWCGLWGLGNSTGFEQRTLTLLIGCPPTPPWSSVVSQTTLAAVLRLQCREQMRRRRRRRRRRKEVYSSRNERNKKKKTKKNDPRTLRTRGKPVVRLVWRARR